MTWHRVDFKAGVIRLDVGTTKSGEGREFVMTPQLRAALEAQRATTETTQRKYGIIIPFVFHRAGRTIKSFYKAWKTACKAAGCPDRIVHDFRRTAVRNLERAGVPRSTAMRMVGHRTMEIYDRYAITDHAMLQEGSAKLAAYLEGHGAPSQDGPMTELCPDLGKVQGKVGAKEGRGRGRRARKYLKEMVGATGFEPATTGPPVRCATGLRYAPR